MGQVFEGRRGVLPRQQSENDDLILEAEVGEDLGEVVRRTIADHVAQLREVSPPHDRRKLVGRTRHAPDGLEGPVALWARELLFHLRQCRPDDVVMVHMGPDGLRGVEPEAMNLVQVP